MHRRDLLIRLGRYVPYDSQEREMLLRIEAFVAATPTCFERTHSAGHVTGSAWVIDHDGARVLLTHHRKLNKWLQLGGHADGNPNLLEVALREAREESGIEEIEPVREDIFDVDVHWIPPREREVGHFHYDIRFMLRVTSFEAASRVRASVESHDLAWVSDTDFDNLETDESVQRMRRKWLSGLRGGGWVVTRLADARPGASTSASTGIA